MLGLLLACVGAVFNILTDTARKLVLDRKVVAQAIKDFGVDPELVQPQIV